MASQYMIKVLNIYIYIVTLIAVPDWWLACQHVIDWVYCGGMWLNRFQQMIIHLVSVFKMVAPCHRNLTQNHTSIYTQLNALVRISTVLGMGIEFSKYCRTLGINQF